MCSGGPNPGGSLASSSEKIPPVSSPVALSAISNGPRSICRPPPGGTTNASTRETFSDGEPVRDLADEVRIDLVEHRRLAVEHLCARPLQQRPRPPAPLDLDHVVERPVTDRDGRQRR